MKKIIEYSIIRLPAIMGNVTFVFWILYNGIIEEFKGTLIEKVSYILLMLVLSANAWLLISYRKLR
ncbi:MAG TPA: hypothetical protein VFN30_03495 [Chitinophagaceae bacterium]|nr:hypothetical protein [Chitinophagaceae bacterium]